MKGQKQIENFFTNINNSYRLLLNIHDKLVDKKFEIPQLVTAGVRFVLPGYLAGFDTSDKKKKIIEDFIKTGKDKWHLFAKRDDTLIMNFIPLINGICPVKLPEDLIEKAVDFKDETETLVITESQRVLFWKIVHRQIELAQEYIVELSK